MTTLSQIVVPTNPADQKKILDAIKEADNSMMRIAAEKDQIKAIIEDVAEKYELPKKYVRKLITSYHKQNLAAIEQENEELVELYNAIVK